MVEDYIKQVVKKINGFLNSLIGLFAILSLGSDPELQCNEHSKQYSYAHSLSQERLEKIYLDIKNYTHERIDIRKRSRKPHDIQDEFSDLKYTRIMHWENSNRATVRLGFCTDKSIDLEVYGLLTNQPIIELAWGEVTRIKEVLWSYKINTK